MHTPGGRLRVTVGADTTVLHGPAVLVASGELDPDWWAAPCPAARGANGIRATQRTLRWEYAFHDD